MKKLMPFLWLLCCLTMIFTLVACSPETPTPAPDEGTGEGEGTTPPADDGSFRLYNEDGTFRYRLVRSEVAKEDGKAAGVALRKALQNLTGQEIELIEDWYDQRSVTAEEVASWYEILIGDTNRPESDQVIATLSGKYDYKIEVVGNKIVIAGYNEFVTLKAVNYLIETYLGDKDMTGITSTLNYAGTYEPLPLEVILEDRSSGATKPRLVETLYPTDDVVIADIIVTEDRYAVSNDGYGDSTKGIQKALDDCAKAGGGTVYLPAGQYIITDKIKIPPFVTLRGDWQDPDTGNEYGTVLYLYVDSKDDPLTGTIVLGGSGGVVGLTLYYPEQSLDAVKPYPHAFYTDGSGNDYMLSTVKNVTVINGYRGIGACNQESGAHEQLTVENFKGTFLYCGAEVYNQADVGTWQDVTVSNKYWKEAAGKNMVKADAAQLDAYTKANTVGLKLGDLEWTEFESLKVSTCKIGIEIVKGKRIQFAGSLLDIEIKDCGIGLQVNDLDSRWGMVIARSVIEGGIQHNVGGVVKLCGVAVTGSITGDVVRDNTSDLSAFTIDYKRSYVKPAAHLYVAKELDKTGKTDVTAQVQALLNEAAATGGVVYLAGGMYRFDGKLTVPAGVELRGASSVAIRDQGGDHNGTLFLCYYGDDAGASADDDAFITLNGDYAGINGIRIVYPENGPYEENLDTTYAVRGKGKGVYIVNSSISAAAYGVDFWGCDEHFVKKVSTCCYYNTYRLGGKGGQLSGCLQNGTVLTRCSIGLLQNWLHDETKIWSDLFDPILRLKNLYIVLDDAEGQQIYNTFCYGCATLVVCNNSTALVSNIGSDNIGKQTAQLVMNSGEMTVINSMRYNGHSYDHNGGVLALYNRLTINNKNEETQVLGK